MFRYIFILLFTVSAFLDSAQTGYIVDLDADQQNVKIFDTDTNTITGIIQDPSGFISTPLAITIHPTLPKGYISTIDGDIVVFSTETNTTTKLIEMTGDSPIFPTIITLTPDGTRGFTGSFQPILNIGVFDSISDSFVGVIETDDPILDIVIASDSSLGFYSMAGSNDLITFNPKDILEAPQSFASVENSAFLALSADDTILYIGNENGQILRYSTQTKNPIGTIETTPNFTNMLQMNFFSVTNQLYFLAFDGGGSGKVLPGQINTTSNTYEATANTLANSGPPDEVTFLNNFASSIQYMYYPFFTLEDPEFTGVGIINPVTNAVIGRVNTNGFTLVEPVQVAITPAPTEEQETTTLQSDVLKYSKLKFQRGVTLKRFP